MRSWAIVPTLDEVGAIGPVVSGLLNSVCDAVVVVDGGSRDGTTAAARQAGARVVVEPQRGYGRAVMSGLEVAQRAGGRSYLVVDGNGSISSEDARRVLWPVTDGTADVVIGARPAGSLRPLQWLGNRLAVAVMARTLGAPWTDIGSVRALSSGAIHSLALDDLGYGWPLQLQARAASSGLRVREVPVHPSPRIGRSKVSGTLRGTVGAGLAFLRVLAAECLHADAQPRDAYAPPLPTRLHLEITNRCNSTCTTCVRTANPDSEADLSLEQVRQIVAGLPELRSIALQVNGEPLLHPELLEIIEHLSGAGIEVELNTNGIPLRGAMIGKLLRSRLARLNVSLDGMRAETYARLRGVDALEQVIANLEALSRQRPERGGPRVSLWMTATVDNLPELPEVVALAGRLGFEEVYLQRLVYFGWGMARAGQSVHGNLTPALGASLARAKQTAAEHGVVLRASGGHPPAEMLSRSGVAEPWRQCRRPFEGAVVMADGTVVPCCISTFVAPRDRIDMGNVLSSDWDSVWHDERYRSMRRSLMHDAGPSFCTECGLKWSL